MSKIDKYSNESSIGSKVFKSSVLILGEFGGRIDWYERWLGSQVSSFLKKFNGIFHLVDYNPSCVLEISR